MILKIPTNQSSKYKIFSSLNIWQNNSSNNNISSFTIHTIIIDETDITMFQTNLVVVVIISFKVVLTFFFVDNLLYLSNIIFKRLVKDWLTHNIHNWQLTIFPYNVNIYIKKNKIINDFIHGCCVCEKNNIVSKIWKKFFF